MSEAVKIRERSANNPFNYPPTLEEFEEDVKLQWKNVYTANCKRTLK